MVGSTAVLIKDPGRGMLEVQSAFRGGRTMTQGNIGDRVIVESERTGRSAREGEITEVLGTGEGIHFQVRWDDGHQSILFPGAGSVTIVPKETRAEVT